MLINKLNHIPLQTTVVNPKEISFVLITLAQYCCKSQVLAKKIGFEIFLRNIPGRLFHSSSFARKSSGNL